MVNSESYVDRDQQILIELARKLQHFFCKVVSLLKFPIQFTPVNLPFWLTINFIVDLTFEVHNYNKNVMF